MGNLVHATTKICSSYGELLFDVVEPLMEIDTIKDIYLQNKGSSIEVQYTDHVFELDYTYSKIEEALIELTKNTDKVFVMFSMIRNTYEQEPETLRRGVLTLVKGGKGNSSFGFYDVDDDAKGCVFEGMAMALAEKVDSLLSPLAWESNIERFEEEFGKGNFANSFTLKNNFKK